MMSQCDIILLYFKEFLNNNSPLLKEYTLIYGKLPEKYNEIVITGTIDGYGRKEIKEIIESFNGSVSESVSKNTDIVIVGSNPGSKYQDALKLNIMIWDNDKTVEVLNNLPKA